MKLYATVSSERATKGQGGNKYLIIEILGQEMEGIPKRTNLYRLSLANDNGKLYAEVLDYSTHKIFLLTKGKRQKGDILNESSDIHEGQHKNCNLCNIWLDKTE